MSTYLVAFIVGDLEAGRYRLHVSAPEGHAEFDVELAAGEHRSGIDIAMEPLATIVGRLVDRDGNPLGGWIAGAHNAGVAVDRPHEVMLIMKAKSDGTFVIRDIFAIELAIFASPIEPHLLDPPQGPEYFANLPQLRVVKPKGGETLDLGDVVADRAP